MRTVALALALASSLFVAPAKAQQALHGPLYVVQWAAEMITDDGPGRLDINDGKGVVLHIPMAVAKDGWLCFINDRQRKDQAQTQSIVCVHGSGDTETRAGATAICSTSNSDVDVQRLTIGNKKNSVGLVIECKSSPVVPS